MAMVPTFMRTHRSDNVSSTVEYVTATFPTGSTYVTGGFTSNLLAVQGGPGSSPLAGTTVLDVVWRSPSGYIYVSTTVNLGRTATTTTKIFSAPGTELANGAAPPDATCPMIITKRKI